MKNTDWEELGIFSDDFDIEYDSTALCDDGFVQYDNKRISCCFTGHRELAAEERQKLLPRLKSTVLHLISLGVKEFHSGAAIGFDTLAASVVYDVSREHPDVRLVLEIPYETQALKWKSEHKRYYEFIKSKANEINVHSENPKNYEQAVKALLKRNRILVDKSFYCVCYLNKGCGGTAYTVDYAKLHDLNIINLAENL